MPDPTITPAQYTAALEALGLDPRLTISVTLQADWAHIVTAELDNDGNPIVELGRLVPRTTSVPIGDAPGAGA